MHKLTKRYLIWSPDAWHHQIHQSEEGRRRMWRNIKWIQLWNATSWHINIFCFHCFNANQKWLIVRLQFFFKNNARFLMFPGSDMEEFCCFSSIYVTVHWIILWFWLIGQNKTSNYDSLLAAAGIFHHQYRYLHFGLCFANRGQYKLYKTQSVTFTFWPTTGTWIRVCSTPVLAQAWTSLTRTAVYSLQTWLCSIPADRFS